MKSNNLQYFWCHQRKKPSDLLQIKEIKSEILKTCVSLWGICWTHHQAQQHIPNMARLLRIRTNTKLSHTANFNLINTCCIRIIISVININMSILAKYQTIQAHHQLRVILESYTQMTNITPFTIFTIMNTTLILKTLFKMMITISHCNNCQMKKTQKQSWCLYSLLLILIKKKMRMILFLSLSLLIIL